MSVTPMSNPVWIKPPREKDARANALDPNLFSSDFLFSPHIDLWRIAMASHLAKRLRIRSIGALSLLVPLAACLQTTGDFGRQQKGFLENDVLGFTGTITRKVLDEPASFYALTEDEKELRDRAWRFLMPEVDAPAGAVKQDQLTYHGILPQREPDVTLYHRTIMGGPYLGTWVGDSPTARAVTGGMIPGGQKFTSLTSRYNRVRDSIGADHALIPSFKLIAAQVKQADFVRRRSLDHIAHLTDEQRNEAIGRICENAVIVARVHWGYHDRAAQYRYSLEHLLVEGPEREAIPAERTLMAFEADLGKFRKEYPLPDMCAGKSEPAPITAPRPLVRKG
jgi:hypothetical protein